METLDSKMSFLSPSLLLRELAGSINYSDSEEADEILFGSETGDEFEDDDAADDLPVEESAAVRKAKLHAQRRLRRSMPTAEQQVEADLQDAVERRLQALPPTTCSICFDDVDSLDDMRVLVCGHRFCVDCCRAYAATQVKDIARVLHKRAVLKSVSATEFNIEFGWVPSIACPAANCGALMCVDTLETFATPELLQRLQLMAKARRNQIDAQQALNDEIEHKNAVLQMNLKRGDPRTPDGKLWQRQSDGAFRCTRCASWDVFPSTNGRLRCNSCLVPYCSGCHISHLRRYGCMLPSSLPSGNIDGPFVRMILANAGGQKFRLCPKCHALIEKNLGCDHHQCRACNFSYNWSQSPIPSLDNVSLWCKPMFMGDKGARAGMIGLSTRTKRAPDGFVLQDEQAVGEGSGGGSGGGGLGSILI